MYNQGTGCVTYKTACEVNFIETYMRNVLSEGVGFHAGKGKPKEQKFCSTLATLQK